MGGMTISEAALHVLTIGDYAGQKVGDVGSTDEGLLYLQSWCVHPQCDVFDRFSIEAFLADRVIRNRLNALHKQGSVNYWQGMAARENDH